MFKATGCKDFVAENVEIKVGTDTDLDVEMVVE